MRFFLLLTLREKNSKTIKLKAKTTLTSIKTLSMRKTNTNKSFDEFMKNIKSSRKTIIAYFVKSMIIKFVNALISSFYRIKMKPST